jgi:hypothetical protein
MSLAPMKKIIVRQLQVYEKLTRILIAKSIMFDDNVTLVAG